MAETNIDSNKVVTQKRITCICGLSTPENSWYLKIVQKHFLGIAGFIAYRSLSWDFRT